MKPYKILLILVVLVSVLSSCETEIDFKNKDITPYMVINSIINPDSVIKVQISKSRFFLEKDSAFVAIENATVKLYVNNTYTEMLNKTTTPGLYIGTYKAVVGDIVKLVATTAEFGDVSGETEINKPTNVTKIDSSSVITYIYPMLNYIPSENPTEYGYTMDTVGMTYTYNFNIQITLEDSLNYKNYYRLKVKYREYYDNGVMNESDISFSSKDNVFGSTGEDEIFGNSSASQYYHEFSDELFDGKNYKLQLSTTYDKSVLYENASVENDNVANKPTVIKKEFVVELQSLSESYYLYLHSRGAQLNYVEFFSEPVQIQSNIINGIGIFGSYSTKRSVIEIPLLWRITYNYNSSNEW